jgi:hypothetical protein
MICGMTTFSDRRELRQKVVKLVDEADLVAPELRASGIVEVGRRLAVDIDLAAVRLFQQSGDMEQRGLAGP